jgi:hypothetical protein
MYVLFLKMKCTCSSNIKVKPFDSCIFCAHKHAASALALTKFLINEESIISLKICSQLILSKWHLSKNYKNLIDENDDIVNLILNLKDFQNKLTNYVENLWELINDNKYDSLLVNNEDFFSNNEGSYKNGMLALSNSIELLKFENAYKNINISYAIGQLVISTWIFDNIDINIAKTIRSFYKEIEQFNEDFKKIEIVIIDMNNLLSKLWLTYLNKYKQS